MKVQRSASLISETATAVARGNRQEEPKRRERRRYRPRHSGRQRRPWWVTLVAVDLLVIAALVYWFNRPQNRPSPPTGWSVLGPQARCADALGLVRRAEPWPIVCQWRSAGQPLEGEAFPPPPGDPPWDHPRIMIYVGPAQTRDQVARVIAHEMGHMYLTRTASAGPAWLRARGLAPDTPATEWVEDYAEVFAAVYGPDLRDWQGMGARPGPAALQDLASQFFQGSPVGSR